MSATNSRILENAVKTEAGVLINGITCQPVVEKCDGCDRIRDFESERYCSSYPAPARKWNLGRCNFATHVRDIAKGAAKVNPLKASKRAAKGKK